MGEREEERELWVLLLEFRRTRGSNASSCSGSGCGYWQGGNNTYNGTVPWIETLRFRYGLGGGRGRCVQVQSKFKETQLTCC